MAGDKEPGALLTIGELSEQLGVAQHILRYWETKFPQLRPMQRAGNRRYYRSGDVDLVRRIHKLLTEEGYTVRGVQKLLRDKGGNGSPTPPLATPQAALPDAQPVPRYEPEQRAGVDVARLMALRDRLAGALNA